MKTINFIVFTIFCCMLWACEKSTLQVATEKTIVTDLQIRSTATLPLLIGKDSLLNVVSLPATASNSKLIWTSSNPEVATVDANGRVKALSSGEATIQAVTTDGGVRKASVIIQSISRVEFITGLNLTASSTSIFEGATLTITPVVAPVNATYQTLNWVSSNPAVATVSETGVLKALKKGNVTITASSTDGGNISKTISIEVKELIPVTAIAINYSVAEPMAIGEVLPLNFTLTPANASVLALDWTSSNPTVVSVSSEGVLTALSGGQSNITVETKDGSGVKAMVTVTVDEGKINDTFMGSSSVWRAATAGSTSVIADGKFQVTMAPGAKYRGDFQRVGGATLHAGKYPIVAFKFNRPSGTGNVIFDTNLGSYLNGNNKLTTITGKDGVQVHYANIAADSFGPATTKLSTTSATVLTGFQLKIADFVLTPEQITAGGYKYQVYWVKSFKTLAELQAYINK